MFGGLFFLRQLGMKISQLLLLVSNLCLEFFFMHLIDVKREGTFLKTGSAFTHVD